MKRIIILALLTVCFQCAFATVYYVSTSGNDATGNGTSTSPWRSLKFAVTKVPASQGHSIKLSAGTFVESSQFNVPLGVSIEGAGMDQTIIKSASSFYYPNGGTFSPEKYLMALTSSGQSSGNQSLKNFMIDGDGKKLHGGIYVQNRNNVVIENVKVQYTNFSAIWLLSANNSIVKGIKLLDCAWGSTGWCSGALQIANSVNVDVSQFDISEARGYGIKNLGHTNNTPVSNVKIHDGRVSVNPHGAWNDGKAPNITIEFWGSSFPGTEIYNCYIDNTLSLVNATDYGPGVRTTPIKIYNNTFDINGPRAQGYGYAIELSINDAEVYGNYFNGGSAGMVNWHIKQCMGWNIHHNTFYNISRMINSQNKGVSGGGLKDIILANNSVEMNSGVTAFLEINGSVAENVKIQNNLFISSSTAPKLVSIVAGGSVRNSVVSNNFYSGLTDVNVAGATISNNFTGDPKINKTGNRPNPYWLPLDGSPVINKGVNLGYLFQGSAPDIGAYENGAVVGPVAVTSVSVTPATVSVGTGSTSQLSITINPSNATNQNVSWSSSDLTVATVSASGLVTAGVIAGTATITCTTADGNMTATSLITVVAPIPVLTVSITSPSPTLPIGASSQLTTVIGPANATNQNVTWTSSNSGIASIDAAGLVKAIAPGSTEITVKTVDGNKTATASITVNAAAPTFDLDNSSIGTGTNQFNYVGAGWAHSANTTDPFFQKTCSFSNVSGNTVTVPFSGIKVEFYTAKASHHGIVAVSIDNGPETNVDLYSATRQNNAMVYSSATLTSGNHTIKIRVTGTKNVSSSGLYAVIDFIKVYAATAPVSVTGVSTSPANVILEINGTSQLTKSITPSDAANLNVTWSSSNATVASVSATGLVTAKAAGTATITATTVDGGKTATSAIIVNGPPATVDLDNATQGTAANQFNFNGSGWVHAANTTDPYFLKTVSYSNVANVYVTISFTGNKIEFYSTKASHHGIVAVSIDNGPETNVDLYSAARQNYAMAFTSGTISQAVHTIKLRVTGTKNSASSGTYVIVDYVKVYSASPVGGGSGGSTAGVSGVSQFQEESTKAIQYYPNPLKSGDILHVNLPEATGEVTLLNLAGVPQRMLNVTDTSLQIPTAGLFEGIYLLQYRTAKGREIVKIMVR